MCIRDSPPFAPAATPTTCGVGGWPCAVRCADKAVGRGGRASGRARRVAHGGRVVLLQPPVSGARQTRARRA
eukprot:5399261-Prymnesium_polylepis.1